MSDRHDSSLKLNDNQLKNRDVFHGGNIFHANEELKEPPEALLLSAQSSITSGDVQLAREKIAILLRQYPDFFKGWLEAGNLSCQLGRQDEMVYFYRKAAQVSPLNWEGWLMLANALEATRSWNEAAGCYHRAVLLAKGLHTLDNKLTSHVHTLMAKFRIERGDDARALESLRVAQELMQTERPRYDANAIAALQVDLGSVLMRLGLTDYAYRAFEYASTSTCETVLTRLAMQSFNHNLWEEALMVLMRNVELHPQSSGAKMSLAHAYAESWHLQEALELLSQAELIAPQPNAKALRATIAGRLGDIDTALALNLSLVKHEHFGATMSSSAAMISLYSDNLSAHQVADLHFNLFSLWGQEAQKLQMFSNVQNPNKRLKLGLLSADLHHQHPVNIFIQPVLSRLNKDRFEVTIYYVGETYDEQTQRVMQYVDNWVHATNWSQTKLKTHIRDDAVDIMLDLSGHTSRNRLMVLAQRVAPVQVSFLGYPSSTGVPNIDWLLADAIVAPPEHDELYTEQVYRLPHSVFCYAPDVDYQYPSYQSVAFRRTLTFGSFNNALKLTSRTIKLWSKIMTQIPNSRLLLKSPTFRDSLAIRIFRDRFEKFGIDSTRIEFRGPVGLSDMMTEYADVDIALDPLPYNGGTTTLQALWMGVPVIVRKGHNFSSRMGASFMCAAGLSEWVANNDEEYVNIAVRMAADRPSLFQLKANLRTRLQALPAWNIDLYTRDIEQALCYMWSIYCSRPCEI
jgi:protein O-GlcNAc transferase